MVRDNSLFGARSQDFLFSSAPLRFALLLLPPPPTSVSGVERSKSRSWVLIIATLPLPAMARNFSGLKARLASALSQSSTPQPAKTHAHEQGVTETHDDAQPEQTTTSERSAPAEVRDGVDVVTEPAPGAGADDDSRRRRQSFASTLSGFKTGFKSELASTFLLARRSVENLALSGGTSSSSSRAPSMRSMSSSWTASANAATPLLTLEASNASFLECTVSNGRQRLYAIDTLGLTTTVSRQCAAQGSVHTGSIKWPGEEETRSGNGEATVQMENGRLRRGSDFLRSTKLMG